VLQEDNRSESDLLGRVETIPELLNEVSRIYAEKPALICDGDVLSYSDLARQSSRFASYLQQQGLVKGDVVALILPNVLAYPIALFGAFRLGLTVVNVNPMYTLPEMDKVISDCGAKAIVAFEPVLVLVEKLAALPGLKCLVSVKPGSRSDAGSDTSPKQVTEFRAAIHTGGAGLSHDISIAPGATAFLQYTGGTSGAPKAAILSHGNIIACIKQYQSMSSLDGLENEIILAPLPLYHIFGLTVCLLGSLATGSTVLLVPDPRDVPKMADLLRKWPVTTIFGVNALYLGLYYAGNLKREELASLKLCASGATALSRDIAEKWEELSGCPIVEGYGMTETSGLISLHPPERVGKPGTVGMPPQGSEVSIRDADGKTLGLNQPGELCVRGPQVMSGYLNDAEETRKAFTADGFLKTGDIARIDEDGFIWLIDRSKDMINVSGFNVYPNEVEQVIDKFDGVTESACVGFPDRKSGEVVKAFIVCEPQSEIDNEELLAHCRAHLTPYKVPKHITYLSALPKSPVGKTLRHKLREKSKLSN